MSGPPKRRGAADALISSRQEPDWRTRHWPTDLREDFEERAAIIEDGCKVTREQSETMAFELLRSRVKG